MHNSCIWSTSVPFAVNVWKTPLHKLIFLTFPGKILYTDSLINKVRLQWIRTKISKDIPSSKKLFYFFILGCIRQRNSRIFSVPYSKRKAEMVDNPSILDWWAAFSWVAWIEKMQSCSPVSLVTIVRNGVWVSLKIPLHQTLIFSVFWACKINGKLRCSKICQNWSQENWYMLEWFIFSTQFLRCIRTYLLMIHSLICKWSSCVRHWQWFS